MLSSTMRVITTAPPMATPAMAPGVAHAVVVTGPAAPNLIDVRAAVGAAVGVWSTTAGALTAKPLNPTAFICVLTAVCAAGLARAACNAAGSVLGACTE